MESAMKILSPEKSPRQDAFMGEFYKTFIKKNKHPSFSNSSKNRRESGTSKLVSSLL